jgi:hypothetical protein
MPSIVTKCTVYIVAVYLTAAIVPLAGLYFVLFPGACLTDTREKFSNLSGFDFEVSYTSCDVIAKEEWISVLVSRGARTPQILLFEYDPGGGALPLPEIKLVGANAVQISVPRISSLRYRRDRWDTLSVGYDIGAIDYPANELDFK